MPRLVYQETQEPVTIGDKVTLRDGVVYTVIGMEEPHKPASTGRVLVRANDVEYDDPFGVNSYYPSVIGACWIERDDR